MSESCESTQLLLADDAPEGAVGATSHQTAGRGRYGRAWEAPQGTALLCSIVVHPHGAPRAGADARRRDCGCRGGGRRDRARRADQVAERRHAQPGEGGRRPRGVARRRRHARHRHQRQPDTRAAAATDAHAPRVTPHDHRDDTRSRCAARVDAVPVGEALRRVAARRPGGGVRRDRPAGLPARATCGDRRQGRHRRGHRPDRPPGARRGCGERVVVEAGEVVYER